MPLPGPSQRHVHDELTQSNSTIESDVMGFATQQKEAALNTDSGMPSPVQNDAMPEAIRGVTKILNECKRTLRNLGMTVVDLKHRIEGKVGQPEHLRNYRQQPYLPLCVLWEATSLRSRSAPSPTWMEFNTCCASCHSVFFPSFPH